MQNFFEKCALINHQISQKLLPQPHPHSLIFLFTFHLSDKWWRNFLWNYVTNVHTDISHIFLHIPFKVNIDKVVVIGNWQKWSNFLLSFWYWMRDFMNNTVTRYLFYWIFFFFFDKCFMLLMNTTPISCCCQFRFINRWDEERIVVNWTEEFENSTDFWIEWWTFAKIWSLIYFLLRCIRFIKY